MTTQRLPGLPRVLGPPPRPCPLPGEGNLASPPPSTPVGAREREEGDWSPELSGAPSRKVRDRKLRGCPFPASSHTGPWGYQGSGRAPLKRIPEELSQQGLQCVPSRCCPLTVPAVVGGRGPSSGNSAQGSASLLILLLFLPLQLWIT